jgi:hypothetical protein
VPRGCDMSGTQTPKKPRTSASTCTPAKLLALRQALDRDRRVQFKNGSVVRLGAGRRPGLVVERPVHTAKVISTLGRRSYKRAYELALGGAVPSESSPPPCWFDPNKRRKPPGDWEKVPF